MVRTEPAALCVEESLRKPTEPISRGVSARGTVTVGLRRYLERPCHLAGTLKSLLYSSEAIITLTGFDAAFRFSYGLSVEYHSSQCT